MNIAPIFFGRALTGQGQKECLFGRALTGQEQKECQYAIDESLRLLGKQNLALIIHGPSFPAASDNEDTGIGSPLSKGAEKLMQFIRQFGFNGIQLGPGGKIKSVDPSPYTGGVFSGNPLFINLMDLAENPKWNGLLTRADIEKIAQANPVKGQKKVDYAYAFKAYDQALRSAFKVFQAQSAKTPNTKFEAFKTQNADWLERDSLYEALSLEHGNDYWPNWSNQLDRELFSTADTKQAQKRIADLKIKYADEILFYQFCQFVLQEQREQSKNVAQSLGMQLYGDRQIGYSDRDVWGNQSVFLKDDVMGAPPDYFSKTGQAWGFPVLDPDQFMDASGNLLASGKLLKRLFDRMFEETPQGVRIDHIIGMIDPWVYPKGQKPKDGARLFSSPEHPQLGRYALIRQDQLDMNKSADDVDRVASLEDAQVERYAQLIKIVLKSASEKGIPKNAIMCEDLGTLTRPVRQVLEKLDLSGLRVTEFVEPDNATHLYRAKNVAEKQWVMPGTHDNLPLKIWAYGPPKGEETKYPGWVKPMAESTLKKHAKQLADDLIPEPTQRQGFIDSLLKDPQAFIHAKVAELFASPAKNIQLFFADFFGLDDTYNIPGMSRPENWSIRLTTAFEKNKILNMPRILSIALNARTDLQGKTETATLLGKLKRFEDILNEQTP